MSFIRVCIFCCVMCSIGKVTMADEKMGGSVEVANPDTKKKDESLEKALPDSHEAMNNRETAIEGVRTKRSYEFLVGLINNNSRYEVTRVDPSLTTQKPKIVTNDIGASEILLELLVRIAAHPDQWREVHQLLKSIDDDLITSKNVVKKLQDDESQQTPKKINETNQEKNNIARPSQLNVGVVVENTKKTEKLEKPMIVESTWPTFQEEREKVNTRSSTRKPMKSTYPKNFAYHRVTGRPIDSNKSPRAYIAVSVIAPKSTNTRSRPNEDEITLEKELHQLKPWTHQDNLHKMASIRSRWVIGEGTERARGS